MDDHPLMCNWLGIEPSWDVLARRLLKSSLHLPSLIQPSTPTTFKLHMQASCKKLSACWDQHHRGYPKSHGMRPQDLLFQCFPFIVIANSREMHCGIVELCFKQRESNYPLLFCIKLTSGDCYGSIVELEWKQILQLHGLFLVWIVFRSQFRGAIF